MSKRGWLATILLGSFALRLILAVQGGQEYWPDETRYQGSLYAVQNLSEGNWREAGRWLFSHADHSLFRWVGLPAAVAEHLLGRSAVLVSSYFSLFSVICIYFVWRLALRAGAGEREALLAAFLYACSTSNLYFSRHYFPYDSALCIMLVAAEFALIRGRLTVSIAAGALAGIGFLIYNGYWLLGGAVLVLHVVTHSDSLRESFKRAAGAFAGLVAVVLGFVGTAYLFGYDLVAGLREDAGTISQGDFRIGYRLIPEYLWHAEGLFACVWLIALLVGIVFVLRRQASVGLRAWLLMIMLIASGLVVLSDVIPVFVIYGRLTRVLVPFLCLVTAHVANRWLEAREQPIPRFRRIAAVVGIVAVAAVNFCVPLTQRFPADFREIARNEAMLRQAHDGGVYRTIGTDHLWGVELRRRLPAHQVILRERHPLQFQAYQYEGFSVEQRKAFQENDITMRLIRIPVRLPAPTGEVVGPLAIRVRFPLDMFGVSEPLITTGRPGAGDMIYVQYIDHQTIRLGYDSWGRGTLLSDPIAVDYGADHDVVVSMDQFLAAPAEDPNSAQMLAGALRGRVSVALDGRVVLLFRSAQHPSSRADVSLAANRIGMTSARSEFSGELRMVRHATEAEVAWLRPPASDRLPSRGEGWEGYSGPVTLAIKLPAQLPAAGVTEPLLVAGVTGAGNFISLIYQGDDSVKFAYEHWGYYAFTSEAIPAHPGQDMTVCVSADFLFPPEGPPANAEQVIMRNLGGRVVVEVNGQIVLDREAQSHPTRTDQVSVGVNRIGGSTTAYSFSGEITRTGPWSGPFSR